MEWLVTEKVQSNYPNIEVLTCNRNKMLLKASFLMQKMKETAPTLMTTSQSALLAGRHGQCSPNSEHTVTAEIDSFEKVSQEFDPSDLSYIRTVQELFSTKNLVKLGIYNTELAWNIKINHLFRNSRLPLCNRLDHTAKQCRLHYKIRPRMFQSKQKVKCW